MSAFKWISGVLGWALFGPIGGIVGFLLGRAVDANRENLVEAPAEPSYSEDSYSYSEEGERNSFLISLLVLSSAIMKADGKLLRSELDFIVEYIRINFGDVAVPQAKQWLKEMLKQEVDVPRVCAQIRRFLDPAARRQLFQYLVGIARADQGIDVTESRVLRQIASELRLTPAEVESALAMFGHGDVMSAYKILEVTADVSDEEVKKAYKRMAVKHHPDKVAHLGPEVQEAASEKFKQVAAAYEMIKKDRGMV